MKNHPLVRILDEEFVRLADQKIASAQAAYMRDQFCYLGLKRPVRDGVQKELFKKHVITSREEFAQIVDHLWQKKYREFHYSALDLIIKQRKLWSPSIITLFERLVRTHSWWDTVDLIAAKLVGSLLEKYPDMVPMMDGWIEDPHLWIRRTAILFQLKWKERTDEKRLFAYCKKCAEEEEFFIRKAIGWALREYSKTAPKAVDKFISSNYSCLSSLSIREGSKYIK